MNSTLLDTLLLCSYSGLPPSPDALPVAVQSTGEAAIAEMVHANTGAGEEEGDPRHVDVGAGPSTALLQLPPVERPEDRLQEVDHWAEAADFSSSFFTSALLF